MTHDFEDEDEVMTKKIEWNGKILPDHHIEHAFTCGDTPYYHFTDAFNIPAERSMDALHVYQEFKNRTDDEFLKAHCQAMDNLLMKNPINIFEIKKLKDQLQERLNMALPPPRIIEMLASVYFFDESENPYRYDRAYGEKKMQKWRTEKITDKEGIETPRDFFLCKRLQDLIPSFNISEEDTAQYLSIASLMDQEHLKTILSNLSLSQQKIVSSNYSRFTNIGSAMKG